MNLPLRSEVENAFAAVLEVPEAEQESFLAREYARDPELRSKVESLLRAHRAAGSFLEPPGRTAAHTSSSCSALTPRMVRKLDLHEDAVVRYCRSAVAIMGFEYAERDRPVPVYAVRCFGVDEPPPTAGH